MRRAPECGKPALWAPRASGTRVGRGIMTNNCVSRILGVLGVLAALTFPATPGNAAEAQTALGGKLVVCGVCHGVDGLPKLEGVPIIWGQQENYILKQLREFKHGERASDVMKKVAINLTEEELAPAAAYFATKNWAGSPYRRCSAGASTTPSSRLLRPVPPSPGWPPRCFTRSRAAPLPGSKTLSAARG